MKDMDILSQDQGIRGSTQQSQIIQSKSREFVREEDQVMQEYHSMLAM